MLKSGDFHGDQDESIFYSFGRFFKIFVNFVKADESILMMV